MKDFIEEDPFLCPECAKVGYCIKRQNNRSSTTEEIANEDENTPAPDESIESTIELMEEELMEEHQ
jgi:hypothetical protein